VGQDILLRSLGRQKSQPCRFYVICHFLREFGIGRCVAHYLNKKINVKNVAVSTNQYGRREHTNGTPLSVSACITSSMYPGSIGHLIIPKAIWGIVNIWGVRPMSNGKGKKAYKNDWFFSVFSLHILQECFYISFYLKFLWFWAFYGAATTSRRQKRSKGIKRQIPRKGLEPLFHLDQWGIFKGVRTCDDCAITFSEKYFPQRTRQVSKYICASIIHRTNALESGSICGPHGHAGWQLQDRTKVSADVLTTNKG